MANKEKVMREYKSAEKGPHKNEHIVAEDQNKETAVMLKRMMTKRITTFATFKKFAEICELEKDDAKKILDALQLYGFIETKLNDKKEYTFCIVLEKEKRIPLINARIKMIKGELKQFQKVLTYLNKHKQYINDDNLLISKLKIIE